MVVWVLNQNHLLIIRCDLNYYSIQVEGNLNHPRQHIYIVTVRAKPQTGIQKLHRSSNSDAEAKFISQIFEIHNSWAEFLEQFSVLQVL